MPNSTKSPFKPKEEITGAWLLCCYTDTRCSAELWKVSSLCHSPFHTGLCCGLKSAAGVGADAIFWRSSSWTTELLISLIKKKGVWKRGGEQELERLAKKKENQSRFLERIHQPANTDTGGRTQREAHTNKHRGTCFSIYSQWMYVHKLCVCEFVFMCLYKGKQQSLL